jgi:sugar lactone lactonase YvrE
MSSVTNKSMSKQLTRVLTVAIVLAMVLSMTTLSIGKDKKIRSAPMDDGQGPKVTYKNVFEGLDLSKFVWPNPPQITRIKYLTFWSGEKLETQAQQKKKSSWMERVSGVAAGGGAADFKPRWQLVVPNGIAIDSKGKVYIADSKVRAIFIVDVETGKYEMIKNGSEGRFQWLTGLTMDDSDRLFAADSGLKRVLVFGPDHKVEGIIDHGLVAPAGLAVDNENRLLYVADPEQDQVIVFDADPPFKKIRAIGTPGKAHTLTSLGDFSKPIGVAVDKDSNLYVTDTWNNRVEVFDADGTFLRAFGKAGDAPGYFARPKGIAIDGDGHVWVADPVQERLQVYTPEGRLLIWMGDHGLLPGSFMALESVAIDANNRVFTTEQYPGRLQVFRYRTDEEAKAEKEQRDAEQKKKKAEQRAVANKVAAEKPGQ